MHRWLIAAAYCLVSCSSGALGLAILAAVESESTNFSSFWHNLEVSGYSIKVQSYEAAAATLKQGGDGIEHLIIFGSAAKSLPVELSPQRLSFLVNSGTNLLLALPPDSSEIWRDFAREFEVDIDDRGTQAIDHFAFDLDADDGSHTSLVLPLSDVPSPYLSPSTRNGPPIIFRGALHSTGRSPLLNPILSVPSTTYSAHVESQLEDLRSYGAHSTVVSAFQARNNARVTFVGSTDLFTDDSARLPVRTLHQTYSKSGNSAFLKDIARWTFGATGQRQVLSVEHKLASGELLNPQAYRVKDRVHYTLEVESTSESVPEDLQLEFTMLDPHLRIPLNNSVSELGKQRFEAEFTLPDRHGVFTIRVDHRRPGWSNLEASTVVSVTPPRHDEYERFIQGAAPYYGGALSVSIGALLFVFFWVLQS